MMVRKNNDGAVAVIERGNPDDIAARVVGAVLWGLWGVGGGGGGGAVVLYAYRALVLDNVWVTASGGMMGGGCGMCRGRQV